MGELLVFGCPGCLRRPGCNGHLCLLFCIGLLLHWLLLQLLLLQLLLLLLQKNWDVTSLCTVKMTNDYGLLLLLLLQWLLLQLLLLQLLLLLLLLLLHCSSSNCIV